MEDNIFDLYQELKLKNYRHSHYTSFFVKDPKLRHIHKAIVKNRVLHHAVFRILYPIFDKIFIYDSYSCRIKKGTHRAVSRLEKFARKVSKNNKKICFILKCDIKRFFDSIDHSILVSLIEEKIRDEKTLWLIKEIIESFSVLPGKGLPLGNITSQLFSNIYLNELDSFIKHKLKIKYYIRYCDDFVVLSESEKTLRDLIITIKSFLNQKLKLNLHSDKIMIRKYSQGIDFLGYVVFPCHRVLRTKTKRRMFRKIKKKIEELRNGLITEESFNQTIQSYFGVLKHCEGYKLKIEIIDKISYDN